MEPEKYLDFSHAVDFSKVTVLAALFVGTNVYAGMRYGGYGVKKSAIVTAIITIGTGLLLNSSNSVSQITEKEKNILIPMLLIGTLIEWHFIQDDITLRVTIDK